jgi:hypothetical protein
VIEARCRKESLDNLHRAMKRWERELNVSETAAIKAGARAVLKSLAKDTVVAEEFREYRDTGETSRTGRNKKYIVKTKYYTPQRRGKDLRRTWQGPWREQVIYAPDEAALKQRRAVIVQMRGLAAESWRQMGAMGRIRVKGFDRASRNKRIMTKAAHRWVEWHQKLGGPLQYLTLVNNLKYIREALKGGVGSINDAVDRGARALVHHLENKLKRAA